MVSRDDKDALLERIEVLSAPVRGDLVDALLVKGSATTAELARYAREGRAAVRWHMERLEAVGMVKRRADSQPTVWEPDEPRMDWSDPDDKEMSLALQELERVLMDRRRRRLSEWALGRWERPWVGSEWSDASISRDYVVPAVRAQDLEWLDGRVVALMDEFRERVADVAGSEESIEASFVTIAAFPWRPGRPQ